MEQKKKMSEILYHRYEYLAKKYASKIFSYEEISFEYEDLVQEFSIKIFTSIKAYGRRWNRYRKGEAPKPVPIRYYLEAACSNKSRDFMKYISRENNKMRIDDINYDYGIEENSKINPERNIFILNGIDLLEGLNGKDKTVFSLFLRGYNTKILTKVYFNNETEKRMRKEISKDAGKTLGVMELIINKQRNFLIEKYGEDLKGSSTLFSSYSFEE